MALVEVDVVGLQPLQRGVDLLGDLRRRQAAVWSRSTPEPKVSQEPSEISETSMLESPSLR